MHSHPDMYSAASKRCARATWGIVLLALMISGCSDEHPAELAAIRAVKVETVRSGEGSAVRFTGLVRQRESASLAFESSGTLAALKVDVGDRFEKGQVLAALDRQPASLRLQQAQASSSSARAQASERQSHYQRQQKLFAAGSVAQSVVEAARAAYVQASSEQARTQADLALARREFDHSQLLAPFAGRVVARRADQHAQLSPGQTVIEVESSTGSQVLATVPVAFAEGLKPGDLAKAWSTSDASAGFDLVLDGVSPRAEGGLTRAVLFRLLQPSDALASGVTVLVQMNQSQGPQPLSVPVQALWMGLGRSSPQVFVYQASGTVALKSISLGAVKEGRATVTQGLSAGEQVVTAGAAFLDDGQTVSLFKPATRLSESAR